MANLGGSRQLRFLLVPGGGGSGEGHWDHQWEAEDGRVERIIQDDWNGGTRSQWVEAINEKIRSSERPTILVGHSLGCIAICHWASSYGGSVAAALLVAPADVEEKWAESGSLYEKFNPIPMRRLPFPTVLVSSSDDPFLSTDRAKAFASAWGSSLVNIGPHGHIGSESRLGNWNSGKQILTELISSDALDLG